MGIQFNTIGSQDGVTANTTPVDVVPSPGPSVVRVVSFLNFFNKDTATRIFTIQLVSGASTRIILQVSLTAGQNYSWTDDMRRPALDATNKKLQIATDAVTTNESPWYASYADYA